MSDVVEPNSGEPVGTFFYLTPALLDLLRRASKVGNLAYIETEYHGGRGGQGAVAFVDGVVAFGPLFEERDAINKALSLLGISVQPGCMDEFESVGLRKHRFNDDYRRAKAG